MVNHGFQGLCLPIAAKIAAKIVALQASGLLLASAVMAQHGPPVNPLPGEQVLYHQDFTTTPALPDELRGWFQVFSGNGRLMPGGNPGNYLDSFIFDQVPASFAGTEPGVDKPFVNGADYAALGVSRISYDLTRISSTGTFFSWGEGTCLGLAHFRNGDSTDPVFAWSCQYKPHDPELAWNRYHFSIPRDQPALPDGWEIQFGNDQDWALILGHVDQVLISYSEYWAQGGIPLLTALGLDNFVVYTGQPMATSVSTLGRNGVLLMIMLVLLAGLAAGWPQRNTP